VSLLSLGHGFDPERIQRKVEAENAENSGERSERAREKELRNEKLG